MASTTTRTRTGTRSTTATNAVAFGLVQSAIANADCAQISELIAKHGSAFFSVANRASLRHLHDKQVEEPTRKNLTMLVPLMALEDDMENANRSERTPLHPATECGHCFCMLLLLQGGADVNTPNIDSYTALHYASMSGCVGGVRILIAHGADMSKRARTGQTALDFAREAGNDLVVKELESSQGRAVPAIHLLEAPNSQSVPADDSAGRVQNARKSVEDLINNDIENLEQHALGTLLQLLYELNKCASVLEARNAVLKAVMKHTSHNSRHMARQLMKLYQALSPE